MSTYYVNTASSGGDGTTNATSGATAAYASMNAWEAARQGDLVTATDAMTVKCCGGADTTDVTIVGWTTNATYDITIEGNADESNGWNKTGLYSTSYYEKKNTSTVKAIRILEDFVTVRQMQFDNATSSGGQASVDFGSTAGAGAVGNLDKCIMRISSSGDSSRCMQTVDIDRTVNVTNCVLYSLGNGGTSHECIFIVNACTLNITNSSLTTNGVTNGNGMDCNNKAANLTIIDSVIFNNANEDIFKDASLASFSMTYSASDDTFSGTGNIDWANEATDWGAAFESYTTYDFRPKTTGDLYSPAGSATPSGNDLIDEAWSRDNIGAFNSAAAAGGATNPKGPLGLPLHGPFGGPIG